MKDTHMYKLGSVTGEIILVGTKDQCLKRAKTLEVPERYVTKIPPKKESCLLLIVGIALVIAGIGAAACVAIDLLMILTGHEVVTNIGYVGPTTLFCCIGSGTGMIISAVRTLRIRKEV